MQNVLDDVICLVIIKSNSRYAVIPEFWIEGKFTHRGGSRWILYGRVTWCGGWKKNHRIVCTAKVGKVIEYESSICNTSSDTTIQKSKKVNLPASAVLVLSSLIGGILARIRARCIKSLIEWWRARRPDPCLHDKEWLPLTSTSSPHTQSWGSPILHPNRRPTAILKRLESPATNLRCVGMMWPEAWLWCMNPLRSSKVYPYRLWRLPCSTLSASRPQSRLVALRHILPARFKRSRWLRYLNVLELEWPASLSVAR